MFKKLFQQTAIYGVATVLPRMLNFLLVPLYTDVLSNATYGRVSYIFAYFVLLNVILSYGMETAFFRFLNKSNHQDKVVSTSTWSLAGTSVVFLIIGFLFQIPIAHITRISIETLHLVLWILFFDAVVVIPFAWLRAKERPIRYAFIKVVNIIVTLLLNVFFIVYLKDWAAKYPFFQTIYRPDYEIQYIFIANLVASILTLLFLMPFYLKVRLTFDKILWKKMIIYAFPVLVAGIAYAVNEAFDRIMLARLLPQDIADAKVGSYAACYKLSLFITLFSTAFRLGIEPFFFSHASHKNARKTYAEITKYFTLFGALILIVVVVFSDLLKLIIIRSDTYWEGMSIVPVVLLANLLLGIYYNLSVWYKVTDKTKYGSYISLISAIITIVANFILIPMIGFMGAAYSTLAAYASMAILSYLWGQKYYPIPYNMKKILGYLGLSMLFSALSFYKFRGNYAIGILFIFVFVSIIYLTEKEKLLKIMKNK